jgi:hypothetical protein
MVVALVILVFAALLPSGRAQDVSSAQEEIVANLAAGRVEIAVVKDAILIATIENPIEVETRPPTPVEISTERAGVILGPVQWFSPSSRQELAQLNRELPHLHGQLVKQTPKLVQAEEGGEAADIESIGQGFLERFSEVARTLHSKLDIPPHEPFVQLIIADYIPEYGPEVWQASYGLEQLQQHGDFWETRVQHPQYLQFWPPEKGQPRTLVEFHYPAEDTSPSLLDLLQKGDPRLEKLENSDAKMKEVAERLSRGDSMKLGAADTTQFLRAALAVIAPNARQTMATVGRESGFAWVLPPPPEPKKPGLQPPAEQQRPEGAPSLLHPPGAK